MNRFFTRSLVIGLITLMVIDAHAQRANQLPAKNQLKNPVAALNKTATGSTSKLQATEQFQQAKPQYGFIENRGQITDQNHKRNAAVKYLLPLPGNNVVLRTTGFSYDTYVTEKKEKKEKKNKSKNHLLHSRLDSLVDEEVTYKHHRVDIEFVNANPKPEIVTDERSEDYINYYTSGTTGDQSSSVHHYGKVTYKNVYPSIDVEFVARPGKDKPIEYNFIVHPGGDASVIQLRYKGANNTNVTREKVELTLAHGKLTESIPLSYRKQSGKKVDIGYKKSVDKGKGDVTIAFSGQIEKSKETLVIDPTPSLSWGTYYGGNLGARAIDVITDSQLNVYMTGYTISTDFISTVGSYQTSNAGTNDAYLVKFNGNGIRVWATYYGGPSNDMGSELTVTISDELYLAGLTRSASGIATPGAHQTNHAMPDNNDVFLVKFNSNGIRQWGTYYGGEHQEENPKLAIDHLGNVFLGGYTSSISGIASPGAFKSILGGYFYDCFLAKFNSNGVRQWATYYGDGGNETGGAVATDDDGNVYLVGTTSSGIGIATVASYQLSLFGPSDGFIAKFNSNGSRLWATYFGGSQDESVDVICIDNSNDLIIAGNTNSTNGISTSGVHQTSLSGSTDSFIAHFTSAGTRVWGTYYGGNDTDYINSIVTDGAEHIYVGGTTWSNSSIASAGAYQENFGGLYDAFFADFNFSGVRNWGSYLGGESQDEALDITLDAENNIYLVGRASSNLIAPSGYGAYIAKFTPSCAVDGINQLSILSIYTQCAVKFNIGQLTDCVNSYQWNFGDGNTSTLKNPIHGYNVPGTYNVSVTISYDCGGCVGEITLNEEVEFTAEPIELEDLLIESETIPRSQVLSSSVSTFSDSWLLEHEASAVATKNSFLNGTEGVWRNNATYVFDAPRSASPTPNVKTDGTYTLNSFDWGNAEFDMIPGWIKANTMTQYSPYSYELENRDVMGIYSAALYDYGGHLPSANGSNMRNREMAFTSFEYLTENVTGNFIFGNNAMEAYSKYEVGPNNKNVIVVKAPLSKLQGVTAVDVVGRRYIGSGEFGVNVGQTFRYQQDEVICVQPHPDTDEWCIIVLQDAPQWLWTGTIQVNHETIQDYTAFIDNSVAHSGKNSLRIHNGDPNRFTQYILKPDSAKRYLISCWVSVDNKQPLTPLLASGLGIDVIVKRSNGIAVDTITVEPSGPIIEGWQQIKGVFSCDINNAVIDLKFKQGGGGTAWYDDLRLHPEKGNMKSYVYDLKDYRLRAILDEENFASFFYYDVEGNLYLTKKETVLGIKTLTENISYQKKEGQN